MASAAQFHANAANAQFSTGPKTAAGKNRSSRNHTTHGLSLGVLAVEPAEQAEFEAFYNTMLADINPQGCIEAEAFQQFIDAAWRLRKIRSLVAALFDEFGEDPFVHPEAQLRLKPLIRYRAAAEMIVYRAIAIIRDSQTTNLYRCYQCTEEENLAMPPLIRPPQKMVLGINLLGYFDRVRYYEKYGANQFAIRFAASNPNPTATMETGPN